MLAFIPEIYNEKLENDNKMLFEGFQKNSFDEFFYLFLLDRFKLKKLVKLHIEETILAVLKYSGMDDRVVLFSQFLGIETQIRREILDQYLSIIKCKIAFEIIIIALPFSFFKLFTPDYKTYLMNSDFCFEIYKNKLPKYKLIKENINEILSASTIYNNKKVIEVKDKEKLDYLILARFYSRSIGFFTVFIYDFKNGTKTHVDLKVLINQIHITTIDFELNDTYIKELVETNFGEGIVDNELSLDTLFNFFEKNNFEIKIHAFDFVTITHNAITTIYNWMVSKIIQFWDEIDVIKEGIAYFKNFEKLMLILVKDTHYKWKITEYFK